MKDWLLDALIRRLLLWRYGPEGRPRVYVDVDETKDSGW